MSKKYANATFMHANNNTRGQTNKLLCKHNITLTFFVSANYLIGSQVSTRSAQSCRARQADRRALRLSDSSAR